MVRVVHTLGGERRREAGLRAIGILHRVDRHHARQDVVVHLHSPHPCVMHQDCDAPST